MGWVADMQPIVMMMIAVGAVIVHALAASIWGTWKLAELKASIERAITAKAIELHDEMQEKHDEFQRQYQHDLRDWTETFAALRAKISDMELMNERTFLRRADFTPIIDSLKTSMEGWIKRLEIGMSKLDDKIESLRDSIKK